MTYAETSKLVKAISDLEAWVTAIQREYQSENTDYEKVTQFETYAAEAREELFDICAK
jgi:hypothetical protein